MKPHSDEQYGAVTPRKPSETDAAARLRPHFGQVDVQRTASGNSGRTFWVELDARPCVAHIVSCAEVTRMLWMFAALEEIGAPVPAIVAASAEPGASFVVQEAASGLRLAQCEDAPTVSKVYRELGALLRRVHGIALDGFGTISIDGTGSARGSFGSWSTWFDAFHPDVDRVRTLAGLSARQTGLAEEALEELRDQPPAKGVLLHNDLHSWHVFVEDAGLSSLIDWGSACVGDPHHDLAKFDCYHPAEPRALLREGYGHDVDEEIVQRFSLVIVARQLLWADRTGGEVAGPARTVHAAIAAIDRRTNSGRSHSEEAP